MPHRRAVVQGLQIDNVRRIDFQSFWVPCMDTVKRWAKRNDWSYHFFDAAIDPYDVTSLLNVDYYTEDVKTRNGQFYINSEGVMVNSMGHQFSDSAGGPITVEPDLGEVSIDKEGQVFQGEELIGEIGIFKFDDPLTQLERIGGGFITKDENFVPQQSEPGSFSVMQGFLEGSNVSSIEEMIGLIEVSRAHEANQKMIQTFDQNVGKAIGTLGQTS